MTTRLDLQDYDRKARQAVRAFWQNRAAAQQKQVDAGKADTGTRGSVTNGKNMDDFIGVLVEIVKANGLRQAQIHRTKSLLTLPGYFRPTKLWDLLVTHKGQLIAAIELKSQVGSFGKNFNNRAEEVIGSAHDLWTAYREEAFGKQPRPFVGWVMLVEDAEESRKAVSDKSLHFNIFPEFKGASYLKRYEILCERLVQEGLYTTAALMTSPQEAAKNGAYSSMSDMTSFKTFVTSLAGHVAAEAARLG